MISDKIREFIVSEFLLSQDPRSLSLERPLVSTGILDSVGMMRLVLWLEQTFEIEITTDDIIGGRLETVASMSALVAERRAAMAHAS